MAWTIWKEFTFEAAHRLPHHDGKCQRLHGHSWRVRVTLHSWQLESDGPKRSMLHDYYDVSQAMKPLLEEKLDHHYLNETIPELENPTSEELARWIYFQLKPVLRELDEVAVMETCTSCAVYREGGSSERGIERYDAR